MKKILFSLLMLCCVAAAWAGTGTGSKKDPYTGEWQASQLIPELKEGKHLAYDCVIKSGSEYVGIYVFDDKINPNNTTKIINNWLSWGVGYAISEDKPLPKDYQDYYSFNSPEVRKTQTFVVTKAEYYDTTHIYITGHYSGRYDHGDGTKENPYWGEWTIDEIYKELKDGVHLAYDCVISGNGRYLSIKDTRLSREVASVWPAWAPGNLVGDTPGRYYDQYCKDNSYDNRKEQTFVVTGKDFTNGTYPTFYIIGHFSGFYSTTDAQGFVHVESAEQMKIILGGNDNVKANDHAKIRLTQDIYLTDIAVGTFCSTFYGTLDGDGHTIHGSHDGTRQNKTYLFTYADGATFKNLNFYNIRIDNRNNHNQAVITSQAKNGCVFENITFDKISTYVGDSHDNTGAAAGFATTNCTFKNITVKNSDFTADKNQSGAVVGHAMNCNFEIIKVEHCESTSRNSYTGGVAGRTDDCTISNVEILGTFIKTDGKYGGGVVGYSSGTQFTNCVVDDQSCVCVDFEFSSNESYAGGIVGYSKNGEINNCINSALITAYGEEVGGIVGRLAGASNIVECLNTGMVITIKMDEVINGFYNKYKTKSGMTCVTKTYQGKEYVIRKYEASPVEISRYGGIAGSINEGNVSKCVNFGSVYCSFDRRYRYGQGGIVGLVTNGTISDCLSDFSCTKGIFGICEFEGNGVSVNNCLNLTTCKDISAHEGTWGDFKGEHNYSLTTAEDAHHTTKTTVAKIKSGEICHLLGEAWEQNLGTDAYPTPTGSKKGIYHTRKVSTQYGTVCVPYPMQSDDNVRFYMLEEVKKGEDAVTLVFTYVERLEAGFPAIFSVAEQGDYTFEPIDDERRFLPPFAAGPSHGSEFILQGTFEKVVFEGEVAKERYYLSGDKIRNAAKVTIEPYRCYILGPDVTTLQSNSSQAKAIRFVLDDENGETTDLELVGNDLVPVQGNGKTYSLMGTEVGKDYRGIVVKNGKKILKK